MLRLQAGAESQLPCIAAWASERQFQCGRQMLGESTEACVQALGLCAQEVTSPSAGAADRSSAADRSIDLKF